jgi:hypothetical protein
MEKLIEKSDKTMDYALNKEGENIISYNTVIYEK